MTIASAIHRVLEASRLCETYNVGGWNEKPNIEIVQWYLASPEWVANVQSGAYREWVGKHYGANQSVK